jgi:two-component system OmpR family sensor kinase
MNSIRRTLLVTLIFGMSAVMLIGAYATYRVARTEANTIFDYYLRQIALSFRDQRFRLNPRVTIPDEKDFDFVIRVWNIDGVTIYYSRPHRNLPNLTKLGYSTVSTPSGTWRVFAIQYLDETIEVAQPVHVRDAQAASAALRTLTPFLFLLPLLGILIWIIVGRGLLPQFVGATTRGDQYRRSTAAHLGAQRIIGALTIGAGCATSLYRRCGTRVTHALNGLAVANSVSGACPG